MATTPATEKQAVSATNEATDSQNDAGSAVTSPEAEGEEEVEGGFKSFIRVFNYGRPIDYVLLSIGIAAAIGSGVALAMVNLVIGQFISLTSNYTSSSDPPDNYMQQVSKFALYYVYIGVARLVLTYVYSTLLTYVALNLTRNLRHQYLRAALGQEVGFFDQGEGGSISMQATSNGRLVQSGMSEKLGQIFQAIATFVGAFVIAFVSQWKLTLILICILPALLILVFVTGGIDAGIETQVLKIYAQAGAYAESVIGSVRTTHAFSLGPRMSDKYTKYLDDAKTLGYKKNLLYGIMFGGEYFVIFAGMGLAFWQGITMIARGEVEEIGTVFTVLFSVIIAASTLNSIVPHMVTFSRAATAAAELFVLIDRVSEINPFDESGEKPTDTAGEIELEGVTFRYPTRPDVRVLEEFSLRVPAGKVTALVGPSGSGKSTIVGLMERWYNPSSGSIKLDGKSIDQLNLKWLRTNVRLVQQEPVLFNGTVLENIANGLVGTQWESELPEQKLQRVQAAAKKAFADDFIQGLPQGYDTRIGERGGLLSGGQKQRIAIARSIVSEPKILLLDEATSALDPHAEGIVQKALDEASKNRTTITIAHKLKTIQGADNIVVMKQGKIVEQGRHDDLVAMDGEYATLVNAQDLSSEKTEAATEDTSEEDEETLSIKQTQSLVRRKTADVETAEVFQSREDFNAAPRTGVIMTIWKLVRATPELNTCYGVVGLACLAGAGLYPGQTILIGKVLDVFGSDDMQSRGNFISLMFFIMACALLVVYGVLGWATNIVAQTFSKKVRSDIFSAFLRQDLRFFDRPENTVGALTSHIDSYAQAIFELMGFNISLVIFCVSNVLVCSILSIVVSWKLGLVGVFAGIPPLLGAGYLRIRIETKMDSDIDEKFSQSASVASETVTAIRTVSSLAIEEDVLRRYTHELDTAIGQAKAPLFNMMIWFSFTQSVEYFILALGFWWGSKLVSNGEISFYQFIVSFMGVYFSGQAAGQLFSFAGSFTQANSAANYYFWICGLQPTIQETEENIKRVPKEGCNSYKFEDVEFSYPLAPDNRVLKGVSLDVEPGQFVAFVGASGCGKSTMISLLERFYDPTSGSITIDGSDSLSDLNPRAYRSRVALVQQEPTLFPGSIRENISMGIDMDVVNKQDGPVAVDDKLIEEACRAANAWDFVSSLPEGLSTPCGTGGSQLSGGQRQRIAIARALIRNPSVILLDEATSALDTESERVVQAALMEASSTGKRITIAVAHRLSTVRTANRIFVFYGGRIVEAGTHSELIAQGGMYSKMCEAQSLDGSAE
ncbi:ATP-binding cassette multidrug transport protein [Dactylonectria estremocensis]|uniref:ATP-binding cassette multidrug transport protein n=1 Tax=Dactylonectria estremocensis TaxID=1079267 RepID=A0A9P9FDG9_9HYPO|nr:ATP-binding cassette multidrug transport protein [Dactylonectria estremocensis]